MRVLGSFDTITIIEPHHDDFCLDMLGTMLTLQKEGTLKRLKVINVFSRGAGISTMPTSIFGQFFKETKFSVIELNMAMIMREGLIKGKDAEARQARSNIVKDFWSQFEIENGISTDDLKERIEGHVEGVVIGPMGLKHPDHNLLSLLGVASFFYREYPYYWNRKESFDARLYSYNVLKVIETVKLDPDMCGLKWSVFARVYKDVLGTFNPRFSRPYFRNVCTEEIYESVDGLKIDDCKHCIMNDRNFEAEQKATHVII